MHARRPRKRSVGSDSLEISLGTSELSLQKCQVKVYKYQVMVWSEGHEARVLARSSRSARLLAPRTRAAAPPAYVFEVGPGQFVDAADPAKSNLARYMNHSPAASPACNVRRVRRKWTPWQALWQQQQQQQQQSLLPSFVGPEEGLQDGVEVFGFRPVEALFGLFKRADVEDYSPRVLFFAKRDLAPGEELCFDYGADYWAGREDEMVV